jgi:hypothetical protein
MRKCSTPAELIYYRVYLTFFSQGEDPEVHLELDEDDRFDPVPVLQHLVTRFQEIFEDRREVCSWDVAPDAFLEFGPYVCMMEEGAQKNGDGGRAIRTHLHTVCPWTRNVHVQIFFMPIYLNPKMDDEFLRFQYPDGYELAAPNKDILYVPEKGQPFLGIE